MDRRMRRSTLGLVVIAMCIVGGLQGAAVAGPKVTTTRPMSDAGYVIEGPGITTTRPVSDPTFLVGEGVKITTTRPLSDAGFVIDAPATSTDASQAGTPSASTNWGAVSLLVAFLVAAAATSAALRRRQHGVPAI